MQFRKFRARSTTLILFIIVFALFSLWACGGGTDASGELSPAPETGSIAFNIVLKASADGSSAFVSAAVDCGQSGISAVVVHIDDAMGNHAASGGPWPCTFHSGTLSVKVGTYTIECLAFDENNVVLYRGAPVSGITVTAGETTFVDDIVLEYARPNVSITSPADNSTYSQGDPITFSGTWSDAQDQTLPDSSLVWTSSLDGQIGTGQGFNRNDLTIGTHTITFTVTDNDGAAVADERSIVIFPSEWVKLSGSISDDSGDGIAVDPNGNAYITGYTFENLYGNTNAGEADIVVTKSDTNGNRIWTRLLGSTESDYGKSIAVDTNGNTYITGNTFGNQDGHTNAGETDIIVTKYDTNGNRIWTSLLGTTAADYGKSIAVDPNGNTYITGYTSGDLDGNPNAGSDDIFVSKYDTNGHRIWTSLLGSTASDYGSGIAVDTNGNTYITGSSSGDLDGNTNAGGSIPTDIFVSKFDANGHRIWTRLLGTTAIDYGTGIAVDPNGDIYITGATYGDLDGNTKAGGADIFVSKYDTNGYKIWTSLLGSASHEYGSSIAVDSNGNTFITGKTSGDLDGNTNAGHDDIFVSKFDTDGSSIWTSLLGTTENDHGYGIALDPNGNTYITGVTYGDLDGNINAGGYDIFIWRLPGM